MYRGVCQASGVRGMAASVRSFPTGWFLALARFALGCQAVPCNTVGNVIPYKLKVLSLPQLDQAALVMARNAWFVVVFCADAILCLPSNERTIDDILYYNFNCLELQNVGAIHV